MEAEGGILAGLIKPSAFGCCIRGIVDAPKPDTTKAVHTNDLDLNRDHLEMSFTTSGRESATRMGSVSILDHVSYRL